MSFTVIKLTSIDGSVVLTPAAGVGAVDMKVTPAASGLFRPVHHAVAFNATSENVELCDLTAGAFAGTLPAPTQAAIITFKKIDAGGNALTITQHAAEKIDGANTFVLTQQWESVTVVSDGTDWFLI